MILVSALLLLWGVVFWYKFIIGTNRDVIRNKTEETLSYLEIIRSTINYNMPLSHKEQIQKTIENVGSIKKVPTLRLLDHRGNIKFSSDKNELGKTVGETARICQECHINISGVYSFKELQQNWYITEDTQRLRAFIPIKNEQGCSTAPCHVHNEGGKINGILEAELPLGTTYDMLRERNIDVIIYGTIFAALIMISVYMILSKLVTKPSVLLYEGLKMVSRGYYDNSLQEGSEDEIGELARAYNEMTKSLKFEKSDLQEKTRRLSEIMEQKAREVRKTQEQYMHTEKLASLGRMVAGVAHELNSPLTGIIIFAQLLLKRTDNKQDKDDLEVIIQQAEKCSNIIAVLLGYSRAIPSEKVDLDVNKTIESALNILQNQARFHNMGISKELNPDLPRIAGDPSQLEQVFINLLINAADALEGKGKVFIKSSRISEEDNDLVEIEFTDSGSGIPEGNLDTIFEPFFTTKPEGKGTGLGLAVSRGIIQKMGGRITVRNKPDAGASFLIHLPMNK
ncbi:MAG: hypothetical protein HQL02_08240 [Nitrospirae bacterium]|nr:hypothetical protein [Nitrospirota bacterium]